MTNYTMTATFTERGKTYAGLPGDFGYNAHMPLFLILPQRDGIR